MKISLKSIIPNPQNPRTLFDEEAQQALVDSLKAHGLMNPISVEGPIADGIYILIDGERRYRAAWTAGWQEIEANVLEPLDDPQRRLTLALVANIHRDSMGPVDEARAFAKLRELMTAEQIAEQVGVTVSMVYARLKLLDGTLNETVLDLLNRKALPLDVIMLSRLRQLPDEQQTTVATRGATNRLSAQTIATICSRILNASPFERRNMKGESKGRSSIAPAFAVSGVSLSDKNSEVVEAIISVCDGCGMADGKGIVCRDCPLAKLSKVLAKNEEKEKEEADDGAAQRPGAVGRGPGRPATGSNRTGRTGAAR